MKIEELIKRANVIVAKVTSEEITPKRGLKDLNNLYNQAWAEEPNSEPDGEIEYSIAIAQREVDNFILASKVK